MDEELAVLRQQCVDGLRNSADYVLKYLDDEEKNHEINKLKTYVQSYCYLAKLSNLKEVKEFITVQDDDICNYEDFEVFLEDQERRLNLNHNNHAYMKNFMDNIKSHQAASSTYDDPEIEIVQSNATQIDPITKLPIRMPVKNKFCGHIYDMTSISEYMRMKNRARCPYVGCRNIVPIVAKNLVTLDSHISQNENFTQQMETQDYDDSQDSDDSL